jgi:hypothetical protein
MARKGFIHLIEVTIVSIMLITFLLIITQHVPNEQPKERITSMVFGYFEYLDKTGVLKEISISKDLDFFYESLSTLIEPKYDFSVGWKNYTDSNYSSVPPIGKEVNSFSYVVSGKDEIYSPIIFEVFIWE